MHSYPELRCGLESLHAAALTAVTEEWKDLTKVDIEHMYNNLQCIVKEIGQHATAALQRELQISPGHIFQQTQGQTNYCDLCALNNAYQSAMFSPTHMDSFADQLWLHNATELCVPLIEPYPAIRETLGFSPWLTSSRGILPSPAVD